MRLYKIDFIHKHMLPSVTGKLKGSYKKADDMMNANFPAGYK